MMTKISNRRCSVALKLLMGATLICAQGCADDQCQGAAPAFEVVVQWEADADDTSVKEIDTLWSHIVAAGLEKQVILDSSQLKSRGSTTFVVEVGNQGAAGFRGEVKLEARGAGGGVLARGEIVFDGTGDSCNFLTVPLKRDPCTPTCAEKTCGADDGCQGTCQTGSCAPGLACVSGACSCDQASCPDGCCQEGGCFPGASDDHCGGGGGSCTDCLQTSQACNAERECISCTPQCDGKGCGAANDCGGTCSEGPCPAGQVCVGGDCICNAASCPNGCCSTSKSCISGNTDPLCGKGGESCTSCATPSQICKDQSCQACTPQCNGACEVDNGCGGTCSCLSGEECDNTSCVPIECRHCADAADCLTQCELWGSTGGICKTPGSSDPKDCCDCDPINSGTNTVGVLDGISGGVASGWSCDPDDPWESIVVHIYVGGPAGDPAASGNVLVANRYSAEAIKNACGGGDYHRYRLSIPNWQSKIGQPVYAYGISIHGGNNSLLLQSPLLVQ